MGHHVFAETDPLGDNHGVWPFLRTYSICKIAAEATARWAAQRFELPTVITRLSVPYGDRGGWPVGASAHDDQRLGHPGPRRRPERLPPPARARHPPHGAGLPGGGVGAGHRRQLGWEHGGEHRGVVHVSRPSSPASRPASSRPSTPSTACSSTSRACTSWPARPSSTGRTGCARWWRPATVSCCGTERRSRCSGVGLVRARRRRAVSPSLAPRRAGRRSGSGSVPSAASHPATTRMRRRHEHGEVAEPFVDGAAGPQPDVADDDGTHRRARCGPGP